MTVRNVRYCTVRAYILIEVRHFAHFATPHLMKNTLKKLCHGHPLKHAKQTYS